STGTVIGTSWQGLDSITPGDMNGDGRADVIARNSSGQLVQYLNSGSGATVLTGPTVIGTGWHGLDSIQPSDGSGDGRADVIARNPSGVLLEYLNTSASGGSVLAGTGATIYTGLGGLTELNVG